MYRKPPIPLPFCMEDSKTMELADKKGRMNCRGNPLHPFPSVRETQKT